MKVVFADTSYYIALLQQSGDLHERALEFTAAYDGRTVTTAWVLMELGNFLSPVSSRPAFLKLVQELKQSRYSSIIPSHPKYFEAGLVLYSKRADKAWSFVDCISFLTMQQHGITDALTADHHFVQAGFNALLLL